MRVYKTESSNLNSLVIQDDRNFNFVFPASETQLIKKTLKLPAGIAWENTGYFLKEYGLSNKEIIWILGLFYNTVQLAGAVCKSATNN